VFDASIRVRVVSTNSGSRSAVKSVSIDGSNARAAAHLGSRRRGAFGSSLGTVAGSTFVRFAG